MLKPANAGFVFFYPPKIELKTLLFINVFVTFLPQVTKDNCLLCCHATARPVISFNKLLKA